MAKATATKRQKPLARMLTRAQAQRLARTRKPTHAPLLLNHAEAVRLLRLVERRFGPVEVEAVTRFLQPWVN